MERNHENDYNRKTADYEPNFILRDPEPKATDPRPQTDPAAASAGPAMNGQMGGASMSGQPNGPRPQMNAGAGIGAGASQARPRPAGSRPLYENPSYDDGSPRGNFTDPRKNFRFGESASWSNGETRRRGGSSRGFGSGAGGNGGGQKKASSVILSKRALAFLIVGCMIISTLFGFGGSLLGNALLSPHPTGSAQTASTDTGSSEATTGTAGYNLEDATGNQMTVKEITAKAKDSVVEIRTEGVVSDSWMQQYVTQGAGSGVIISKEGYIMTNNHVIDGANKIKVTTSDKKEYDATLVGTDEDNDVAVIKVDANGLTPATYGNSDQLEVGDLAVAIGNPLGELGGTVTAGIISAKDRALSIDGKTLHLLQTDSSINPGNSGGGLFNGSGQLVGLVVAKSKGSDVEGLGFAIPINTAANVAQQLIDKGYVSGQPSTGMTYQEGTAGGGDSFGSFDALFGGETSTQVVIYSVNGKNAKKAGFEPGDIVTAIDGEEITSFDALSSIVTSHKVGDTLTFTIVRNGYEKKIKLVLEEKTKTDTNSQDEQNSQQVPDMEGGQEDPGSQMLPDEGGSLFDYFFGQ